MTTSVTSAGQATPPVAERTAVYRLFSSDGELLYVGTSGEPGRRFTQHTDKHWWPEVTRHEIVWHDSRQLALAAESAAIRGENPKYNRLRTQSLTPGVSSGGIKTSVWLGKDLRARWKASELSLTEIVKLGLDAAERAAKQPAPGDVADNIRMIRDTLSVLPDEDEVRAIVREELSRVAGESHA
jgi:predicted GIY-YIG superfamily endonuclease